MNIFQEFVNNFLTTIYRILKFPKNKEIEHIIEKSIKDKKSLIENIKKVRQTLDEKIPRKLRIDRSILPKPSKKIVKEVKESTDPQDFIRNFFTYCLMVINNEAYLDMVNDKVPKSIAKMQKLLKSRLFFQDYYSELFQSCVFHANFSLLLCNCGKSIFSLKFATKALEIIERVDFELKGMVRHRARFMMKNTQNFLM